MASKLVDELVDRKLKKDEDAYLDVLGTLIEQYETEHHEIEPVSDREMLQHLIEARGASKRQVALESGIAVSTMSELVSGKRPINRTHIQKLAKYFNVEPGVFLNGDGSPRRGIRAIPAAAMKIAAK